MPSINMIAPRQAEKKRLERNMRRLLLVILVQVVVIVLVSGLMASQIFATRIKVADLANESLEKAPTVRKIDQLEKSSAALKPKLDTLNKAKSDTLRWCRIMDRLSVSLPDKTWLTRVSTAPSSGGKASGIVININGVSANQNLVGDAMMRMHDMVADFDKIDLHYTQNTTFGFTPAVEFEVAAGIKVPQEKDKGEVGKS